MGNEGKTFLFQSELHQVFDQRYGYALDVRKLYDDMERFMVQERKRLGLSEGERVERGHPIQHVLNSTSGGYWSPTSMKSFELCPAGYLVGKLFLERVGTATSVGRTYHTIMQLFYDLDGEERSYESIQRIMEETIEKDQQFECANDVRTYVERFWEAGDYLGGAMDHRRLQCATEVFIKPEISPLGVTLDGPLYTLIDRVDVRNNGIWLVDYKTGMGDPNPYMLGANGYLPQMVSYKWAAEKEYGQPVRGVLLCCPGADTVNLRWVRMNVDSLVEQSRVVEQVHNHLIHARQNRERKLYECKVMRYCGSCPIKTVCGEWIHQRKVQDMYQPQERIPVQVEVHEEDGRKEASDDVAPEGS